MRSYEDGWQRTGVRCHYHWVLSSISVCPLPLVPTARESQLQTTIESNDVKLFIIIILHTKESKKGEELI